MKRIIFTFFICFALTRIVGQNFDRVTLSAGGMSDDRINYTIGELFVFSVSNTGVTLESGSQSSIINTGGIHNVATTIKPIYSDDKIVTYPNPVTTSLNIQISENKDNLNIEIFDLSGKLIKTERKFKTTDKFDIDVTDLASSNYLLKISSISGKIYPAINFIKIK